MWDGPFTDNHMHIDPINGLGLDAVRQFTNAGGTHLILVGKMASDWGLVPTKFEDFLLGYNKTLALADKINNETSAKAFPIMGFHPAEFVSLADRYGTDYAFEIGKKLLKALGILFLENKIYGIGEIGRPHFPVEKEIWDLSNELMKMAFTLASEIDCPLQLHTEHFDENKFEELAVMIRNNGKPKRVIKHFSPPMPLKALENEMTASIVSSKDSLKEAISRSNRFLMETDYIDDNSRPGAVLGPKTVPKRTKAFLEAGIFSEEDVAVIHKDLVSELYGIEIE